MLFCTYCCLALHLEYLVCTQKELSKKPVKQTTHMMMRSSQSGKHIAGVSRDKRTTQRRGCLMEIFMVIISTSGEQEISSKQQTAAQETIRTV